MDGVDWKHKIGPLPVWGWGVAAGGVVAAFVLYSHFKSNAVNGNTASNTTPIAVPVPTAGATGGSTGGSSSNNGDVVNALEQLGSAEQQNFETLAAAMSQGQQQLLTTLQQGQASMLQTLQQGETQNEQALLAALQSIAQTEQQGQAAVIAAIQSGQQGIIGAIGSLQNSTPSAPSEPINVPDNGISTISSPPSTVPENPGNTLNIGVANNQTGAMPGMTILRANGGPNGTYEYQVPNETVDFFLANPAPFSSVPTSPSVENSVPYINTPSMGQTYTDIAAA